MSQSFKTSSAFALFVAGLSLIPTASAYKKPVGDSPSGNAIYEPGLNSVVPAGQQFSITWEPTTSNCETVDIVLLKGPSTNAVYYSTIVENTTNNGSFPWIPSMDLAPQTVGYGIQLICDASGAYQYSTQFGISNPSYVAPKSTSSAATTSSSSSSASPVRAAASSSSAPTTGKPVFTTEVVTQYTTYCPYATKVTMNNQTYTVSKAATLTITDCPCTITHSAMAGAVTGVPSSGYLPANSSIVKPTGSMSVPSSLRTTAYASLTSAASTSTAASSSSSAIVQPQSTGAAAQFGASLGGLAIAAAVAVLAL